MRFHDHFSHLADDYHRYRPTYPPELYSFLRSIQSERRRVWDVATGSGQAATALADDYAQVVATDASAEQIQQARPHPRIDYRTEPAERTSIADASVDAVVVAAGLHWLDLPAFYSEVRRVAKPGAVFMAWTYTTRMHISPAVDSVVEDLITRVLAPYWPPQFQMVRAGYASLPLPWAEQPAPVFTIRRDWTLAHLRGHIDTWSASGRMHQATGTRPSTHISDALAHAWGDAPERPVEIPLALRWGRQG